jgi:hypothetical protein
VESGAVIEGLDVIEDGGAGLGAGSEAMMVGQFLFETAKEGLDEGVIVAIGFATHGGGIGVRWRRDPLNNFEPSAAFAIIYTVRALGSQTCRPSRR